MNTPIIKRSQREEQRRMQAAELFECDLSNAEIARRLHVSRMSVSHWYQTWKEHGSEGLKARRSGQKPRLNAEQIQQILEALLQGPEAQGFPTPLWTLSRISELIQRLTGISYHPGHVWYLLQAWDWSCQKPEPAPKERDEAEIAHWLSHTLPRIKKGHRSEEPSSASSMKADSLSNPACAEPGHRVVRHRS